MVKGYFLIITCFCTRAVHIELTPDFSVKSFLLAVRDFSRCAIPKNIISNNFKTCKTVAVQNFMGYLRIKWIFCWKRPYGGADFMRGWYVQLRTP